MQVAAKAAGYLRRLPRRRQEAVAKAFEHLRHSPFRHPSPKTIRPLKGDLKGLWRYRLGDLRIVYSVDVDERTIRIVTIDKRGDVY